MLTASDNDNLKTCLFRDVYSITLVWAQADQMATWKRVRIVYTKYIMNLKLPVYEKNCILTTNVIQFVADL